VTCASAEIAQIESTGAAPGQPWLQSFAFCAASAAASSTPLSSEVPPPESAGPVFCCSLAPEPPEQARTEARKAGQENFYWFVANCATAKATAMIATSFTRRDDPAFVYFDEDTE
jgi:hypothetical protein